MLTFTGDKTNNIGKNGTQFNLMKLLKSSPQVKSYGREMKVHRNAHPDRLHSDINDSTQEVLGSNPGAGRYLKLCL